MLLASHDFFVYQINDILRLQCNGSHLEETGRWAAIDRTVLGSLEEDLPVITVTTRELFLLQIVPVKALSCAIARQIESISENKFVEYSLY